MKNILAMVLASYNQRLLNNRTLFSLLLSSVFQNLQSTNWQTMRFKPPPPNSDIGWRVEFRPMEVMPRPVEHGVSYISRFPTLSFFARRQTRTCHCPCNRSDVASSCTKLSQKQPITSYLVCILRGCVHAVPFAAAVQTCAAD